MLLLEVETLVLDHDRRRSTCLSAESFCIFGNVGDNQECAAIVRSTSYVTSFNSSRVIYPWSHNRYSLPINPSTSKGSRHVNPYSSGADLFLAMSRTFS